MFDSANNDQGHKAPVKRNSWGWYVLPAPSAPEKGERGWQRVTTLAKMASDMNGIMNWKMRYVAKGIATKPSLHALASSTDLNDKTNFDRITNDAFEAAGGSAAADTGTAIHAFTEQIDEGLNPNVPKQWVPDVNAYKRLVSVNGLEFPVEGIERIVVNEKLEVAGTFDRIARVTKPLRVKIGKDEYVNLKEGDWVVADLKTGQELSYGWRDIAVQLAIYANADAMWNPVKKEFEPLPDLNKLVGLVIHLPAGKAEATLYGVDLKKGAYGAELCAAIRDWRKERNLASMVGQPVAEDPFDSVMDEIYEAESREDLVKIYNRAVSRGVWTDEHTRESRVRVGVFEQD